MQSGNDYLEQLSAEERQAFLQWLAPAPPMPQSFLDSVWSPYKSAEEAWLRARSFVFDDNLNAFKQTVQDFIEHGQPTGISEDGSTPLYHLVGFYKDETEPSFELCYYVKTFSYIVTQPTLELYSIVVPEQFRRRGLANWIMNTLETTFAARGIRCFSVKAIVSDEMSTLVHKRGYTMGAMVSFKQLAPSRGVVRAAVGGRRARRRTQRKKHKPHTPRKRTATK